MNKLVSILRWLGALKGGPGNEGWGWWWGSEQEAQESQGSEALQTQEGGVGPRETPRVG